MAAEWRRGRVPTALPLSDLGRPRGPWLLDGSEPRDPRHPPPGSMWARAGSGAHGRQMEAGPGARGATPVGSWQARG